ncbi:ankyrin repeat domain-containing protein [Paenibacillus cremeus]|uniref:Ankyrin repeat domain-containing protein n=1 Tax=Paenibacillus cremeus TaxID=2163881 RepID=A0A559JPU2_9BACL|nr:ankyrin repeat domain-containing protein [Paenibacillus cremeus]TVY01880.1 ankyrin repeat domain-containing protein [Paenibacillus cremeus]
MEFIYDDDTLAIEVVGAIRTGDTESLGVHLAAHPQLVHLGIVSRDRKSCPTPQARTLLHIATDWPGHYPNGAAIIRMLVDAGANVNARFTGPHTETPLHWAASNDDIDALDALLDAGADIEAPGAGRVSRQDQVIVAFWCACHGGQPSSVEYLLHRGADLSWASDWDGLTPLDAAKRSEAHDLVQWLIRQGAKSADELR